MNTNARIYKKSMIFRFQDCSFSWHHLPTSVIALISDFRRHANWQDSDSRNIEVFGFDLERDVALIKISKFRKSVYLLIMRENFNKIACQILTCRPRSNPKLKVMLPDEVVAWAELKIAQAHWLITH
jgi:hypothetical protein